MRVAKFGEISLALMLAYWAVSVEAADSTKPGQVIKDCADCPEVVVIPAGAFVMGADLSEREREGILNSAAREQPRHAVSINRSFALGRTEVTRAQYGRFAEDTRRSGPPECAAPGNPEAPTAANLAVTKTWKSPGYTQSDGEPAVCVSWEDAKAYVAWLSQRTGKSYRLPTEAEWEYAARAGTTTARYWGDAPKTICRKANVLTTATLQASPAGPGSRDELVCNSDHKYTMPVASFDANPFGLYDMIGNVLEAVEDCFHPNYNGAPVDGSAWQEATCQGRILRGGSFNNLPWFGRAAFRATVASDHRGIETGLRVARDLETVPAR
jgi:sulfatase modifying factor 1